MEITWSTVPDGDVEFASTPDGGAIAVYAQKSGGWGSKVGVVASYEGYLAYLSR
jgi:hypothetical protein